MHWCQVLPRSSRLRCVRTCVLSVAAACAALAHGQTDDALALPPLDRRDVPSVQAGPGDLPGRPYPADGYPADGYPNDGYPNDGYSAAGFPADGGYPIGGPPPVDPYPGPPGVAGLPDVLCDPRGCGVRNLFDVRRECRHWLDFDFLFWETKDPSDTGTILNTTSTDPSSELDDFTYSGDRINTDPRTSFRLMTGWWLDDRNGVEVGGHYVNPYGDPRTFSAATFGGGLGGGVTTNSVFFTPRNLALQQADVNYEILHGGVEVNLRRKLRRNQRALLDGILGIRHVSHDEAFDSELVRMDTGAVIGESFRVDNDLWGVQAGAEGQYLIHEYVSLAGLLKVGLMNSSQDYVVGGPPVETDSGLLTGPGNLGSFSDNEFSVLVEYGADVVFHITPSIEVNVGWRWLYLGEVGRALAQIDVANAADNDALVRRTETESVSLNGLTAGLRWTY